MHLVLCHVGDVSALRTYRALRARAPERVSYVSVEALCAGLDWAYRFDADSTAFRVRLVDGRVLDGDEIESVLNRVWHVAPVGIERASEEEATYAREEFTAFVLGWLASLRRVVNPPTPQGLAGRYPTALEWTSRAARAGLPVIPRLDTAPAAPAAPPEALGGPAPWPVTEWVYVVGDRVVGPRLGDALHASCVALARSVGVDLLGIGMARAPGGRVFVTATPTPTLPADDAAFVDALTALLGVA